MHPEILTLFGSTSGGMELYTALETTILERYPGTEIRPRRTQVGFFDGCGFAWAWPARKKRDRDAGRIGLTLGLGAPVTSARIAEAVEPYPGRWTHHLLLSSPAEIDAELLGWLDEAHSFAASRSQARS